MKDNKLFLNAIGDNEKCTIIQYCIEEPKTAYDIIHNCGVPQTNAYRKLKSLVADEIIIKDHDELKGSSYTQYYKTRSDFFIIEMGRDKIEVIEGKYQR